MNEAFLNPIKKYLKTQPVTKAWVFGSFSRGEERQDSDIDILVEYDRKNAHVGLFTIVRIVTSEQHYGKFFAQLASF